MGNFPRGRLRQDGARAALHSKNSHKASAPLRSAGASAPHIPGLAALNAQAWCKRRNWDMKNGLKQCTDMLAANFNMLPYGTIN
jgi:hypothetical protein